MTWPAWIEELKRRYLAGEASVFLLHGPGLEAGRWEADGIGVGAVEILRRFLERSRDILGIYDPRPEDSRADPPEGKVKWSSVEDWGRFRRLVEARLVLDGVGARPDFRVAEQALGLFWTALTTAGPNQGYIILQAERLSPRRRSALEPLALGAPPLDQWATAAALRRSDNVVVLCTGNLDELRPELAASALHIEVPLERFLGGAARSAEGAGASASAEQEIEQALAAARAPEVQVDPAVAQAEVDDALSMRRSAVHADLSPSFVPPAPAPVQSEAPVQAAPQVEAPAASEPAPVEPPAPEGPDLQTLVREELRAAILRHPDGAWPGNLPGREALARVLHTLRPDLVGDLAIEAVEDQVRAVGEGAEWFEDWYSGDIAVDAAVGMALGGLALPEGGFTAENLAELPVPAVRALARRIEKLLARS